MFPITYFKSKIVAENSEDALFKLYKEIDDRNIVPNSSLYNYNYAMEKEREYKEENNIDLHGINYNSETYKACYEVFKNALEEKEDNTEYTLYSPTYGYIKTKGVNGAFYYGYSSPKETGKYKEMYVKAKMVDRDIKVVEVV